jgi:hypothetical protein
MVPTLALKLENVLCLCLLCLPNSTMYVGDDDVDEATSAEARSRRRGNPSAMIDGRYLGDLEIKRLRKCAYKKVWGISS